jgi:hypothetical protein
MQSVIRALRLAAAGPGAGPGVVLALHRYLAKLAVLLSINDIDDTREVIADNRPEIKRVSVTRAQPLARDVRTSRPEGLE